MTYPVHSFTSFDIPLNYYRSLVLKVFDEQVVTLSIPLVWSDVIFVFNLF